MGKTKVSREDLMKREFGHYDYRREILVRAKDEEPEDGDYYILEGKAVSFNDETILYKGKSYLDDKPYEVREIIDKDAFKNADISDVFLKYNHSDQYLACARTKNGTLELDFREDGVYIRALLNKRISAAVDLYEGVRSGLIDKMSFAFTIAEDGEDCNEEHDGNTTIYTYTVRNIAKMYDVAAVNVPAYDNTSIYARRMDDVEALQEKVEALRREKRESQNSLERQRSIMLARLAVKK